LAAPVKVDFIICGTQKGGTTALDAYLRSHSKICMAEGKEVHFFDNEDVFSVLHPDYSLYHAAFSPSPTHRLIGEATPIYMYWYDAPRRMWEYNPQLKIIVLLRNPIERAYSQWNMARAAGDDDLPFLEAIKSERTRCRQALPNQHRFFSYVDRGFYSEQLRRLWTFFPPEQVLILKSEDLRHSPAETLQKVCAFLEVDTLPKIKPLDIHSRPYTCSISRLESDFLRSIFEFEIRCLERMLNWDCSHWLCD
jgi:hypothetical protein